jgi:hypothetical protein
MKRSIIALASIALASAFALSNTVVAVAQSGSSTMPTGVPAESKTTTAEPMNGRTTTSGTTGPTMMNGATTTTAGDVNNKASSEGSAEKKDNAAPDGTMKK